MDESRTKNTKRNIIFSYIETISTIVFAFVSRSLIVHYLGDQYLGLSSLFKSILQVLGMAELGFSSAIVYNMYKPLAEGNTAKVCSLLFYYRKVYRIVGLTILVVGVAITPFLPKLINGDVPKDVNLYAIYLVFLANTVVSYFAFAYKTALLEALQRLDLTKKAYFFVGIVQYVLQIVLLITTRNYMLFILVMVANTIIRNIVVGWIASRKYPQYFCKEDIDLTTKKDIIQRVKGLLISNVSAVTYTTLDSIILSSMIGLTAVAIYNNYFMICNQLLCFVALIRSSMQASVGNSVAKESVEKNYNDMLKWQFLFALIATWCITCMVSLYQPFMTLWMGKERLLTMLDVCILCIWFFFTVAEHSFFLYLSGNGLWWEMRWPYIMSSICNLILNIVFGKMFGITGILLATLLAGAVFGLGWQCVILFKNYFRKTPIQFYIRQFIYFFVCVICCTVSYLINTMIRDEGILGLVLKGLICTTIFAVVSYIAYSRTSVYKTVKQFAIQAIRKHE